MLLSGRRWNMMRFTVRFPEGIAPACPIHTKPVIPFDARLSFELYFPQWHAAVGLCGSFDFLKNVQLGHRNSLLWRDGPFHEGGEGYSLLPLSATTTCPRPRPSGSCLRSSSGRSP